MTKIRWILRLLELKRLSSQETRVFILKNIDVIKGDFKGCGRKKYKVKCQSSPES